MDFSHVCFHYEDSPHFHRCGYCNGRQNANIGMMADSLTNLDYQLLIDRNCRRSGKYVYKPSLKIMCCPLYTIRCGALDFSLRQSQKTIIKAFNRFISTGEKPKANKDLDSFPISKKDLKKNDGEQSEIVAKKQSKSDNPVPKAKVRRFEKKVKRFMENLKLSREEAVERATIVKAPKYPKKTIKDLLQELEKVPSPKHNFEIRLVRSNPMSKEFKKTSKQSHALYVKYQTKIHDDDPYDVPMSQWQRFLVDSPLPAEEDEQGRPSYGSFHHQYWLDGNLIAVGVIDILPYCLSSVYFYYDPDYSFLRLGTYSALREVEFTRELHEKFPEIIYYYMGFYVHSCGKMKYKGQYRPSYLLCGETFTWHPIEKCEPLLDATTYARFADSSQVDSENPTDEEVKRNVKIVSRNDRVLSYKQLNVPYEGPLHPIIRQYVDIVGRTLMTRMGFVL